MDAQGKRRKRTLRLFAAALLTLTLAACGGSPNAEKVVNIAYTTAWGSFNPYYSASATMYELSLYDKIYDKLVFTDIAGVKILPRAAYAWASADDGYSIVFYLNEKARWSDGQPATAHDWAFTVNLLADPDSARSPNPGFPPGASCENNVPGEPETSGCSTGENLPGRWAL